MKKIRELIKKIREIYRMIIRIKNWIETESKKEDNDIIKYVEKVSNLKESHD